MSPEEIQLLEDLKKVFADLKKPVASPETAKKKSEDAETEPAENKEGKAEENKEAKIQEDDAGKTTYFEQPKIYSTDRPTAVYTENYHEGDSSLFVPGTYLQIFRQHEYLMGSGLFGYTTPSMGYSIVVRGDLKGEPFRDVRSHESYHWTQRAGEFDTREATGTHMDVFLPKLNKMYSSV